MSNGVSGKEGPFSSKTERGRRRVAGGFDRKCSSKLGETKSPFHFEVVNGEKKRKKRIQELGEWSRCLWAMVIGVGKKKECDDTSGVAK